MIQEKAVKQCRIYALIAPSENVTLFILCRSETFVCPHNTRVVQIFITAAPCELSQRNVMLVESDLVEFKKKEKEVITFPQTTCLFHSELFKTQYTK